MNNWFDSLAKDFYSEDTDFVNTLTKSDKVRDLKITGNTVSAKVVSGDDYNSCEITFNKFTEKEKEILNQIVTKPIILYKLSNSIFPDEILDCGVTLFPESGKDFTGKCSCGVESGNCQDVLYLFQVLSKMMLENPFLIFTLRGFEFSDYKFDNLKMISEIFSQNFNDNNIDTLRRIGDISTELLRDENFGEGLEVIYTEVFKILQQELVNILYSSDFSEFIRLKDFKIKNFYRDDIFDLFCEKWGNIENISLNITSDYELSRFGLIKDSRHLFSYLVEMNQFFDGDFDDNLRYLLDLMHFTFSLIGENALVPQIFRLESNKVCVRWIPALYDGNILEECERYAFDCPDDFITYGGRKISRLNQVIIAVSLIFKGLIDYYIYRYGAYRFKNHFNKEIYELFFEKPMELSSSYKKELASQIAQKLSVFEMRELDFGYLMTLKDSDEGMYLELAVERDGEIINLEDATYKQLSYLSNIYEIFSAHGIKNQPCEKIFLTPETYRIFKNNIRYLLKFINVRYDVSFEIHDVGLKLKLDLNLEGDYVDLNNLDNFEWKVLIGDDVISIEEFNKIYKHLDSIVKINGSYYTVDKNRLNVFQGDIIFLPKNFQSNEVLQISLMERYRNLKFEADTNLKEMLNISKIVDDPDGLNGTLRNYQRVGVSWLLQNIKSGFGSILADDMGLGKTVQILACILYLKENRHLDDKQILIIAPTTLLSNWKGEIEKFAPTLTYSLYHGNNRKSLDKEADIILTSFGMIRSDIERFNKKSWFLCVVDEAQNIKNPSTKQTKAVKSIKAFNKIALTGTPIENRLLDYWSIFDFTNEGYLFSRNKFKKDYVNPIENTSGGKVLENFKKITKPFILRRLKSDKEIIKDLPEKHVNDIYCNLTDNQAAMYDKAMEDIFAQMEGLEGISRKGMILKLITQLKQICNHPSQFKNSKKFKTDESGKSELLMDILENILDSGEKVIIFTQYVKMGELLEKMILKRFNREVLFMHGSLSREARENIIDKFQNDSHFPILIATLKTGGVGLNLTAAQNVIHYDLWWNPAVENQATDRAYRIGQKKDVMVYRLITKGTLEEQIDLIIKNKLELAGRAIDSEETFITEMSDEELLEMLSLR